MVTMNDRSIPKKVRHDSICQVMLLRVRYRHLLQGAIPSWRKEIKDKADRLATGAKGKAYLHTVKVAHHGELGVVGTGTLQIKL